MLITHADLSSISRPFNCFQLCLGRWFQNTLLLSCSRVTNLFWLIKKTKEKVSGHRFHSFLERFPCKCWPFVIVECQHVDAFHSAWRNRVVKFLRPLIFYCCINQENSYSIESDCLKIAELISRRKKSVFHRYSAAGTHKKSYESLSQMV